MSKDILIKKGWNMISYPDETSVSSLNIQPENPISDAWYWYLTHNQMLIIQIVFINHQRNQKTENLLNELM